jgi:hypothetical protein
MISGPETKPSFREMGSPHSSPKKDVQEAGDIGAGKNTATVIMPFAGGSDITNPEGSRGSDTSAVWEGL